MTTLKLLSMGSSELAFQGFLIILMLTSAKPAIPMRMKAVPVMITTAVVMMRCGKNS